MRADPPRIPWGWLVGAGVAGLLAGLLVSFLLPVRYRAEVALTAVRTPDPNCPFTGETGGATFAHLGTIRDLLLDESFLQELEEKRENAPSTASYHVRNRTDSHHLQLEVEADTREEASRLVTQWAELGVRRVEEVVRRHLEKLPEEHRSCAEAHIFRLHKPLPWKPKVVQARLRHQGAALAGLVFGLFGVWIWFWRRKKAASDKDGTP